MDAQLILPKLVWRRAQEIPETVALVSIGQAQETCRQVWDRSRQWAGWQAAYGVGSSDRVAALVPQSLDAAHHWMGCCLLGATEVAINCEFRGEWLRHALRVSSAKVAVTSARYLEAVLAARSETGIETVLVYYATDVLQAGLLAGRAVMKSPADADTVADQEPAAAPHDLACILLTSGTTGASKAVQIHWAQLHTTARALGAAFDRCAEQVFYFPYANHHITGRGALYCPGLMGGRSVTREAFSTNSFLIDIRTHRCTWTVISGTPARFVANLPSAPDDLDSTLELVLLCPVVAETDLLKRRFGIRSG